MHRKALKVHCKLHVPVLIPGRQALHLNALHLSSFETILLHSHVTSQPLIVYGHPGEGRITVKASKGGGEVLFVYCRIGEEDWRK